MEKLRDDMVPGGEHGPEQSPPRRAVCRERFRSGLRRSLQDGGGAVIEGMCERHLGVHPVKAVCGQR